MRKNTVNAFTAWTNKRAIRSCRAVWTDGVNIYSYGAKIVDGSDPQHLRFNAESYSRTTSNQQNSLRQLLRTNGYNVEEYGAE